MGQKYTFDEGGVAFYYFLATVIALYVIPKTIKLLWSSFAPEKVMPSGPARLVCICEKCTEKESGKTNTKGAPTKFNLWLAIGWAAFATCIALALKNTKEETKLFDPFEILNISSSSSDSQIRKAFKRLSLKFHPDKAKEESERAVHEKKFLEITRAYRALTDETARKNWEEYGNPDGPKSYSLGIALPSWLVDSKYNLIVVLVYMLMFGVGLPMVVKSIWEKSKEYTRDNILHSSMQYFYKEMKDAMSIRRILDVVCGADEFKENVLSADRLSALIVLINENSSEPYDTSKKVASSQSSASAHALLFAHMVRAPMSQEDRSEADKVVLKTIRLLNGIYQISIAKKWPICAMNCMSLSALLVQGLWENSSPLLQLPYLKADILKHCNTKKRQVKTIKDVIDMDEEERSALFRDLSESQVKNLVSVAKQMPLILCKSAEFKMLGQEQVNPGGLVTCLINLELVTFGKLKERLDSANKQEDTTDSEAEGPIAFEFDEDGNITEGGKVRFATQDEVLNRLAPVHAPYFPVDKRPGWWVILMTRNMSHMVAPPVRVNDLIDRKTVSLQFAAPPRPGKYPFTLIVRSDCLLGIDIQREVDLNVVPLPQSAHGTDGCCSHSHSESSAESGNDSDAE